MKTISLRDNVAGRHGDVLRSSAIFYVRETSTTRSTVSFMNYWKLKRGVDVAVIASTREMSGRLVHRERLHFELGDVINYRAPVKGDFEGSIEIEVFATRNMVIPYSAIVCIYETAVGYSVVHGYARAYSSHEIEEGRTLTIGREGCWTIRDDERTRSIAVVHNGSLPMAGQTVRLRVSNYNGESIDSLIGWGELKPFETRMVRPSDHVDGLTQHLRGLPGQAQIDFELGGGFTRMLIGNERLDGSDLQVTHSNFDYSRQSTDLTEPGAVGHMVVPRCGGLASRVVVYGQSHPGRYVAKRDGINAAQFASGETTWIEDVAGSTLSFVSVDRPLATRLVTAIEVGRAGDSIRGECSLGMLTALQPPKRMWWGTIAATNAASTRLVIHDLPEIYGGITASAMLEFALYSAGNHEPLKSTISASQLSEFDDGVEIEKIWIDAAAHLGGQAGYYTLFCEYGGLSAYSLMENKHGSVCLEHGF